MAAPQDLDPELIAEALTKAEGSVWKAAKTPSASRTGELRRFCLKKTNASSDAAPRGQ